MTDAVPAPGALPTIRLTMPARLAHTSLVRACLRDAIAFGTEDAESRFLLAATEVVVNAIEASNHQSDDQGEVIVIIEGSPAGHVEIRDSAGWWTPSIPKAGHLGAGLTIAQALVPLQLATGPSGTVVRLGIEAEKR